MSALFPLALRVWAAASVVTVDVGCREWLVGSLKSHSALSCCKTAAFSFAQPSVWVVSFILCLCCKFWEGPRVLQKLILVDSASMLLAGGTEPRGCLFYHYGSPSQLFASFDSKWHCYFVNNCERRGEKELWNDDGPTDCTTYEKYTVCLDMSNVGWKTVFLRTA